LLDGAALHDVSATFPIYKAFMMAVSVGDVGGALRAAHAHAHRAPVQAALTRPDMVERSATTCRGSSCWVFGGGVALAALAGVIGGNAFVTEPGMAAAVADRLLWSVSWAGLGSLTGAFVASLAIGILQTLAVAVDWKLPFFERLTVSQTAPVLPYLIMVLILIARPRGLMGTRES
jgi:branched-chain amino acid transport system permease protein